MLRRGRSRSIVLASALSAALLAPPIEARAAHLQLALVVDHGAPVTATLEALHAKLRDAQVSVEVALVHVRRTSGEPCTPVIAEAFTSDFELVLARIEQLRAEVGQHGKELEPRWPRAACNVPVDVVPLAIEALKWRDHTTKRLLALGRMGSLLTSGRTTLEEAVGFAERRGIVVHAVEYERPSQRLLLQIGPDRLVDLGTHVDHVAPRYADDVERFLASPTAPLGRVPAQPRHATLLSGGTFHVTLGQPPPPRTQVLFRDRYIGPDRRPAPWTWARDAWGPRDAQGHDALDALALGLLRPSEVPKSELPKRLQGVAAERRVDRSRSPRLDRRDELPQARRGVVRARFGGRSQREGSIEPLGAEAADVGLTAEVEELAGEADHRRHVERVAEHGARRGGTERDHRDELRCTLRRTRVADRGVDEHDAGIVCDLLGELGRGPVLGPSIQTLHAGQELDDPRTEAVVAAERISETDDEPAVALSPGRHDRRSLPSRS